MKKLKMARGVSFTFEEGCNKYLENCRQRNLREGTINHYRQSYLYFYKYFDPKMPIEDIDEQTYKDYVLHLKATLDNDTSINSYLRDLITTNSWRNIDIAQIFTVTYKFGPNYSRVFIISLFCLFANPKLPKNQGFI